MSVPSMKVEIDGIAICMFEESGFESEGIWRVLIPKIDSHDFQIIINKKVNNKIVDKRSLSVPLASKINLSTSGLGEGRYNQTSLEKTIDITESRLHNSGVNLSVTPTNYAAFITIPGISLKSSNGYITEGEYEVWKTNPVNNPTTKTKLTDTFKIKSAISSYNNVLERATSSLIVENNSANWLQISKLEMGITHEEDVDYEFIFANLCNRTEKEVVTDFKLYYNVINGNSNKYEMMPSSKPLRCRQPGCSVAIAKNVLNYSAVKQLF